MSRRTTKLVKAALSALHYSRAGRLFAPLTSGQGVIFMLHHVRPEPPKGFEPNRILKITPEFLDAVIREVKRAGFDAVSLDEASTRLEEGREARPFVCFTLDDGYRDNRDFAYPVFKRHGVPFTIYVPSNFPSGGGELWWLALEEAIRVAGELRLSIGGEVRHFRLTTERFKDQAFHTIYWLLRGLPEREARASVSALAGQAGIDVSKLCANLVMSCDELRDLARDPLVTIGAHTRSHFALAKLSASEAREEMAESVLRIEQELCRPCRHFSYPYGDAGSAGPREFRLAKELGLRTAVTTEKGLLHREDAGSLTSLPRLSLNGDYQDLRFVQVMLSGAPFALWNWARRLTRPRGMAPSLESA